VRFLHVEPIRSRSGRYQWTIAPHAHAELHQILLVMRGGGTMRAEAARFDIRPPALLVIPAGVVHAFDFSPEIDGSVVTVADAVAAEITRNDPFVGALFRHPACLNDIDPEAAERLSAALDSLEREFLWLAPARSLAIEAELLRILVAGSRLAIDKGGETSLTRHADDVLLDRFRQLVEQDFRSGTSVGAYAAKLCVTEDRLLAACRRRLGGPPKSLIHRRIMVEAQRWLLYSAMSVGEISFALGFRDPAYFSRFFLKRAGRSPKQFRSTQIPHRPVEGSPA
jgi:AraC family transcriptional regulator, transcriptional activator of pobA